MAKDNKTNMRKDDDKPDRPYYLIKEYVSEVKFGNNPSILTALSS